MEEMLKDQIEVKAPNCPECGRRLQWNGSAFKHGAGSASCSVRDGKFDAEGEIVEEQKPLSKDAVILPRNDFVIIRKVQLVAAQYDRALTPILSIATDHYYRVFFRNDGTGAGRVKAILDRHQPVHVDSRTHTVSPCATGSAGPLWTGPLHDKAVVDAMRAALEAPTIDPAKIRVVAATGSRKRWPWVRRVRGAFFVRAVMDQPSCIAARCLR